MHTSIAAARKLTKYPVEYRAWPVRRCTGWSGNSPGSWPRIRAPARARPSSTRRISESSPAFSPPGRSLRGTRYIKAGHVMGFRNHLLESRRKRFTVYRKDAAVRRFLDWVRTATDAGLDLRPHRAHAPAARPADNAPRRRGGRPTAVVSGKQPRRRPGRGFYPTDARHRGDGQRDPGSLALRR